MRTLLISILLICSWADGRFEPDCGEDQIYKCWAPEKCFGSSPRGKTIPESKVKQIEANTELVEDCDVIIRFHQYNLKRTFVWIESYIKTLKKIEFMHKDGTNKVKNTFSCEFDAADSKIKGKFLEEPIYINESKNPPEKLECKFDARKTTKNFFDGAAYERISFTVTDLNDIVLSTITDTNRYRGQPFYDIERCDPTYFDFVDDKSINSTRRFKAVQKGTEPGKYFCDEQNHYTMEYLDDVSKEYKKVGEIDCVGNTFKISGSIISKGKSINIRCAADADFFCMNELKIKDNESGPKFSTNSEGRTSLKCPFEKPHLIIVGVVEKIIENPEFKCLTFGSDPIWTVGTQKFTGKGPEIYCTKQLKCNLRHTIVDSVVEDGFVSLNDFLPKCYNRGILKTLVGKHEATTRCDLDSGKFKYTAGGAENVIDENTKFYCDYPPDQSVAKKNEENDKKIRQGSFIAAGVGAVLVIGTIAAVIVCSRIYIKSQLRKNKAKYEAKNKVTVLQYCPTPLERKASRKLAAAKQNQPKSTESNKPDAQPEIKWNAEITTLQYKAMTSASQEDGTRGMREELASPFLNHLARCNGNPVKKSGKKYAGKKFEHAALKKTTSEVHKKVYRNDAVVMEKFDQVLCERDGTKKKKKKSKKKSKSGKE